MTMSLTNNPIARFMQTLIDVFEWMKPFINDIIILGLRIWLALIFWKSGLTKTGHFDTETMSFENWESALFLFEYEYAVPFLPVWIAAFFATLTEILAPLFIVVGLGARFAAIPLLIMTIVIQLTYISSITHLYWGAACAILIVNGAGRLSWDYLIARGEHDDSILKSGLINFIVWGLTLLVAYEFAASLFDIGLTPVVESALNALKETT